MRNCWFCAKKLTKAEPTDKHHVLPKRYGRRGPIMRACVTCHCRFHRQFDNPNLSWPFYLVVMERIDYGFGLFAK